MIRRYLYDIKEKLYNMKKISEAFKWHCNSIILIGSPEHGNLGDHAISIAELNFFKKYFPNKKVIEISGDRFRLISKFISRQVKKDDLIVITGGGFLGDLWMIEEKMVRDIIKLFPKNKIIIFPQTIYFVGDLLSNPEFLKSKVVYESHNNLTICLRDKISYDFIREHFSNIKSLLYIPDMVLSGGFKSDKDINRKDALFCFREDKEKVMSDDEINKIRQYVQSRGIAVNCTSTVNNSRIEISERDRFYNNKLLEFASSKIVFTDRLHGMIFSAICGTPCIAFDNASMKVGGVYKWISYLPYIKCVNSADELEKYISELLTMENCNFDNTPLLPYFNKLSEVVKKYVD